MTLETNNLSQIKTITNTQGKLQLSPEFQGTTYSLIIKLNNHNLRHFMIDKIFLDRKQNIKSEFTSLEIFEKSLPERLGAFYTSGHLVKKITAQIEFKPNFKYLDPAVGTGNFIIILTQQILTKLDSYSLDEIINSIYGFDLDLEAIENFQIRFVLELQSCFSIDISTYKKTQFLSE